MQLLKLKYKNLFSLGEGEINLQNRGLTLITGYSKDENNENGAGKSTLANKAILWTLFGVTANGTKADAVINRHGKRTCFGEISFIGIDNNKYKVKRQRPADLSLFKGSEDISGKITRVTQDLIDKALGFSFKSFLQTSVFGQGKTIHYPALMAKDQKAILEQILPIEQVNEWTEYTEGQIKLLKPKLEKREKELNRLQERAVTLKEQFVKCNQDKVQFEKTRQENLEKAKIELENVRQRFEPDQLELDRLQHQIQNADINETRDKIAKLNTSLENTNTLYEQIRTAYEDASRIGGQWRYKLTLLETEKKEINTATKCPVCLRDYDKTTIEAIHSKLDQQDKAIEEARSNQNKCLEATKHHRQELDSYQQIIDEAKKEIEKLNAQFFLQQEYRQKKQFLESRIELAESSIKTAIAAAECAENPHEAVFLRINREFKETRMNEEKIKQKFELLKEETEHLQYWRGIYGKELKIKLFEDACPFLDARTEYHLEQLKSPHFHCEFSTIKRLASGEPRDDFNVVVWSETGGRGFDSLSGGEQQIVNFAVGLALADLASQVTGSTSNFMILDEPLTELSARNSEAVVDYLMSEIGKGKDTIFLISNEESLKGLIHNRIHVTKHHGVSSVVSE